MEWFGDTDVSSGGWIAGLFDNGNARSEICQIHKVINGSNNESGQYIPNFTEQSLNSINKIYNLSENEQKIVYLTFDDGPSRDVTPLVLDVLKEENIKATFFVLGQNVDANPNILKRVYDEGHYIANHRLFA